MNPKVMKAIQIISLLVDKLTPFLSNRDWTMRFRRETKDRLSTLEEQVHKLTQAIEAQKDVNEGMADEITMLQTRVASLENAAKTPEISHEGN